jgi:hypothetical protein
MLALPALGPWKPAAFWRSKGDIMRYIAIEPHEGFVWFDSIDGGVTDLGAVEFIKSFEESIGEDVAEKAYELVFIRAEGEDGYFVYEVPDKFPREYDSESSELVRRVMDCDFAGYVVVSRLEDAI